MAKKNWIAGAVKEPGAFTKKAAAAGKSVPEFAAQVVSPGSGASAKTKRQANLARTFERMRNKHGK